MKTKAFRSTLATAVCAAAILALAAFGASAATPVIGMSDPVGDDYGPGSYVYPTNSVFAPGAFDIVKFEVFSEGEEVRFDIAMAAPIGNPWGGPNGISVQMYQIYIDTDQDAGYAECIPGANVTFADDSLWDKAIVCEGGWGTEVEDAIAANVDPDMAAHIHVAHKASVSVATLSIWVPADWLGTPADGWGYQVLVMSQEGSREVMDGIKVRRVLAERTEWQLGGSDESGYHPNVVDMLDLPGVDQKTTLSAFSKDDDVFAVVSHIY